MTAQQNLANSNNQLQTTLTRLSTGLRINSAADDPAGMIAATDLGSNIAATQQAISNSQVASQMISTADSALSQISSLLTTINGLVTQAANTSSMSSSQIAANQLQIDSSLSAINSIAQTTNFQGQNLLNGSLGFLTQGTSANYASTVQNLQVTQANMGTAASVPVNINVVAAATQAQISDNLPTSSGAGATATLQLVRRQHVDHCTGGQRHVQQSLRQGCVEQFGHRPHSVRRVDRRFDHQRSDDSRHLDDHRLQLGQHVGGFHRHRGPGRRL